MYKVDWKKYWAEWVMDLEEVLEDNKPNSYYPLIVQWRDLEIQKRVASETGAKLEDCVFQVINSPQELKSEKQKYGQYKHWCFRGTEKQLQALKHYWKINYDNTTEGEVSPYPAEDLYNGLPTTERSNIPSDYFNCSVGNFSYYIPSPEIPGPTWSAENEMSGEGFLTKEGIPHNDGWRNCHKRQGVKK